MVNVVSEVFSGQSMVLSCKDSLHWFYYLLKLTRYWIWSFGMNQHHFAATCWSVSPGESANPTFETMTQARHKWCELIVDGKFCKWWRASCLQCFHGCLESCKIHGKLELSWGHTPLFLVPSDFLKIRIRLIWTRYILRLGDILVCTVLYQLYSSASVL